jgi:tRNA 2-thiouridine synthesizing protein A
MEKTTLKLHRMLCPMPVIKVQNCVKQLPVGDQVEAICTDPGALNDIPAWCRINGHQVIECRTEGGEYIVLLQVGDEQ